MKDIALGVAHHGTATRPTQRFPNPRHALVVFSRKHGAVSWHYWKREQALPDDGRSI